MDFVTVKELVKRRDWLVRESVVLLLRSSESKRIAQSIDDQLEDHRKYLAETHDSTTAVCKRGSHKG